MIELSQQLTTELDITYWQLNKTSNTIQTQTFQIGRDEKELLRKILLAKGITLTDNLIEVKDDGVVVVHLKKHLLIFADVKQTDTDKIINLAKVSSMLDSPEQKKLTWYKLKGISIN